MNMSSKSITVDIGPAGDVKVEAHGFAGNQCEKATEQIELVLGGKAEKKKKPEYYNPATTNTGTKLTF